MSETGLSSNEFEAIQLAENRRRDLLCRVLCLSTTFLVALFAIHDFIIGQVPLALTLCFVAASNSVALCLHYYFKQLELFCFYLAFSSGGLCLYLAFTSGTDNTGLLWASCFPVFMHSVFPARRALYLVIAMFIGILSAFFIADAPQGEAVYSINTKLASICSFLLIAGFTFFQSLNREKSASDVAVLNHELSHIASVDELTHLANRRDMSLRLEFEAKRAARSGKSFSIILCDIDYFKKINDSFGHSVGDQALRELSNLLQDSFRSTDKVARWGGEEFLIALPNTDIDTAINLAEKMRKRVCQATIFPNMPNRLVTMSCGVASSADAEDISELLKIADQRLYQAKNSGRNRVIPTPGDTPSPIKLERTRSA